MVVERLEQLAIVANAYIERICHFIPDLEGNDKAMEYVLRIIEASKRLSFAVLPPEPRGVRR